MAKRYQARAFDGDRREHCPSDAVYVGRRCYGWPATPWENPYRVGIEVGDRYEAVRRYETHARRQLAADPDWLAPLVGKDLICWCPPDDGLPCHADVLLALVAEVYADAAR